MWVCLRVARLVFSMDEKTVALKANLTAKKEADETVALRVA